MRISSELGETRSGVIGMMDRKTLWLSLFGGCLVVLMGIRELYRQADWTLFIIGVLIIAFSISGFARNRGDKQS